MRGWLAVSCAVLQVTGQFGRRAIVLLGQPALQLAITWWALDHEIGLEALPAGLALSVIPFLVWSLLALRSSGTMCRGALWLHDARNFASARFVAVVIGVAMSQGDRWILTAIGAFNFLPQFDVANRLASLPAVVTLSLLGGVCRRRSKHGQAVPCRAGTKDDPHGGHFCSGRFPWRCIPSRCSRLLWRPACHFNNVAGVRCNSSLVGYQLPHRPHHIAIHGNRTACSRT